MAVITLGGYPVHKNPASMTIIKQSKSFAMVPVYSDTMIAYFSWGCFYAGLKVELKWPAMDFQEYEFLERMCSADAQIIFNPQDGSGYTFYVILVSLDGEYHIGVDQSVNTTRKEVVATLLVLSKV